MRNVLTSPNASSLGLLLARAPLGAFMLLSGFGKFSKPDGVDAFVQKCIAALPTWLPHSIGEQYFRVVHYAEIVVGASLLLGVATRIGGLFATVLLATCTLAVSGVRATDQPFHSNVLLLGVSLMVVLAGPGMFSMDQFMWSGAGAKEKPRDDSAMKRQSASLRVRFAER